MTYIAARAGELAFSKVPKVNLELFLLTYGAMVVQLLKDFEDVNEVNKQLDKMGYNIGLRIIDEFLAKSGISGCRDFRETMEALGKVGFKMFLGVGADITNWNAEFTECSLCLSENPLIEFVELPERYQDLLFSNILCGVIRGSLEMINLRVECHFLRDQLRGADITEIRVSLKEILTEHYPFHDD